MAKTKVFMIMPFTDEFFEVYEMLRREFEEGFDFSNAAVEGNQQNILKDIIQPLYETDIVIADLTGLNPNVLYELGVAHTFNKKVIVITQDDLSLLPFDLKQYRAKDYSTHFKKFAELLEYLGTNLYGAVSGGVVYSNPVKDFLSTNGIKDISWFSAEGTSFDVEDNSDKGFIDYLADIDEDIACLSDNINTMISDMNIMSDGVNKSTGAIEQVNKKGGSGTASFIQKEARKVAGFIGAFSTSLREHNKQFSDLWNKIEKNTLGLIENPYVTTDENKEGLISFLKTLKGVQVSIHTSSASVEEMRTSSLGNIGIQRTLNQSIRFLDEDLKNYMEIMDFMSISIDKIIGKSKFVVGEIDFNEVEQECDTHDDLDIDSGAPQ